MFGPMPKIPVDMKASHLALITDRITQKHLAQENYLMKTEFERWRVKRFGFRYGMLVLGVTWSLVFTYGRLTRVLDYFEYDLYIK